MSEGKELGFLVILIILVSTAAVMLMFLHQINKVSDQELDVRLCRKSVDMTSIANIEGLNSNSLNCPTTYASVNYGDEKRIKKILADNMADCWYKFGEGRKEIFSKTLWKRDKNYCAICSVIRFNKDAKSKQINNFLDYLKENNVKKAYCNKDDIENKRFYSCDYFSYLLPYSSKENINKMYNMFINDKKNKRIADTIDTSNDYATVLVYSKHSYIDKKHASLLGLYTGTGIALALALIPEPAISKAALGFIMLGGITGASTGYAAGSEKSSDWKSGVALIPYTSSSLKALNCEELPIGQKRKFKGR